MEFAISRILVPVDFSPHSDLAVRYATALAGRLGASVDLLHVVEDPFATGAWNSEIAAVPDLTELREHLIGEAERQTARYRTIADAAHVPMVTSVRTGLPSHTILDFAHALGPDLIIMGTHGRSGLTHLIMGSVAERMVRHAPCPVLTLRETAARQKTELMPRAEPAALGSALGHQGTSRE